MDRTLESHLTICLDQLDAGKSVEEILAAYPPETAVALRPMLVTFQQIRQLPAAPTLAAKVRSEKRFLAEATRLRSRQSGRSAWSWLPDLSWLWGGLRVATAVGLLLIFLFGGLILVQAPNSLPGDTLYGAKLALEEWRLALSQDADGLQAELAAERRHEVRRLLAEDRREMVTFTGQLAGSDEEYWLVDDIPVIITTDTEIVGSLSFGVTVRINGQTAAGRVWAAEVIILPSDEEPTPLPGPSPTATVTPTATDDPPPPADTLVTPTPSPTSAAAPVATVTATNTAVPVVPPPPSHNNNQNDNSGNDDDHGDYDDDDDDDNDNNNDNGN